MDSSPACFVSSVSVPIQPSCRIRAEKRGSLCHRRSLCHRGQETSPSNAVSCVAKSSSASAAETSSPLYYPLSADVPVEERPSLPPYHWTLPRIGFLVDHLLGKTRPSLAKKYGPIYNSSFVSGRLTFISDMDAISAILKNPKLFTSKGSSPFFSRLFGENSMILADGQAHSSLRKPVAPAFAPSAFPFLFDKIRARAEKTWAHVERNVRENGTDLLELAFRRHFISVIVEMTTGVDMDSDFGKSLVSRFFILSSPLFALRLPHVMKEGMAVSAELVGVLEGLIRRALVEKKGLIDKLREYGDKLTFQSSEDLDKGDVNALIIAVASTNLKTGPNVENDAAEIRSLADTMLLLWFAGYLTTCSTACCAAFELGMDPAIRARLTAEQDALVRRAGHREVTYAQVAKEMPLLDSFVTEILRLYPATQATVRAATQDVSILGRYVKAGERLFLDIGSAMRDPRKYPDPDTLQPDRFLRSDGRPPAHRVLAFGAPGSPHYCLGAALSKTVLRTTLAVVLREYTLVLDPEQSRELTIMPSTVPKSKVVVCGMPRRG